MKFRLFTPDEVVALHDAILSSVELSGLAGDKSLEGALSRIEFRLQYGKIDDAFDLAATYATQWLLPRRTLLTTATSELPMQR